MTTLHLDECEALSPASQALESTSSSAPPLAVGLRVAYLVNQYPQPSHSFIRREIAALESLGVEVERFTLRRATTTLVDERDRAEQLETRAVLDTGLLGLTWATLRVAMSRPAALIATLLLAVRLGSRSERGLLHHLVYLAEACALLGMLQRAGVQHVHAHFGTNSTAVAMLCRALGGPAYSFTVHGPEEFDKPEFLHLSEKIARAAFVVAISEFGRSQLCRWCPHEQWGKIHVVRCGVDDLFFDLPASPPPDVPRLACIARLQEQKGLHVLIAAAARLRDEGLSFQITIIGDGTLRPELEALIARHGLTEHVLLPGWKSNREVRQELLASRAMVLPSFAEGLPVVIMESLALHRPVITTYVAGIPELVEPGACGWLVPAGAVEPLCTAMREALLASQEELARLGEEGARRVAQRHNARHEAAKLLSLIVANRSGL